MPATAPPAQKTYTSWNAFARCKVKPTRIVCSMYKPFYMADFSCHSKTLLTVDALKSHMEKEHGSAYTIFLAKTDGRDHGLWKGLEEAGLEAKDFRCAICNKELRFNPVSMQSHLRPHAGMHGGIYRELTSELPGCIGVVNITLDTNKPDISAEDFEDEEPIN